MPLTNDEARDILNLARQSRLEAMDLASDPLADLGNYAASVDDLREYVMGLVSDK